MKWFEKEEKEVIKYQIVEVKEGSKLPEITADLRESLKTLQYSPAFNYILMRLRFQKAAMETSLREGLQLDEKQLRYLQAGIYWASQIERDISALTQVSASTPRPAFDNEADEFNKIHSSLELIDA